MGTGRSRDFSKTDRKDQTIQYVYDSLYRMTSKTYPDSTSANYVYDLVSKIQAGGPLLGTPTDHNWGCATSHAF
jgi:YD repeat-containing protein